MAAPPPPRRESPPAIPVELVEEILLRLPPDEPAWLLRASLVCKSWGSAVSHPSFRRRLHELYGAPPVLGFLHNRAFPPDPRFIPTTASPFSLAAADCGSWRTLDCRHGRALFLSNAQAHVLVWEPITGAQQRVPVPTTFQAALFAGAVVCAADGCDHSACHGGPFRVVAASNARVNSDEYVTVVCAYSSETCTWGEATSVQDEFQMDFTDSSTVLAGRSLLYFMSNGYILEYDLARNVLTMFDALDIGSRIEETDQLSLVLAEDGGMRVCEELHQHLKFWKMEASDGPDMQWVLTRVINLGNLPQIGAVLEEVTGVHVVGFAEGPNVIFVDTIAGIFAVELQSEKARKVCDKRLFCNLIPVVTFYTPMHRGEHQDLPSSGRIEDADGEDRGQKEKAIEQPQQLFDKGSNAIEEGDRQCPLQSRPQDQVSESHGEVALECASTEYGCALLYKAQTMNDPLDDVPKSASNAESVMGTTSKDDVGNSKTSGSNVEDAAPPPQKGSRLNSDKKGTRSGGCGTSKK